MVSAGMVIERKHMMTSSEKEVRYDFEVEKAAEVVVEEVVSFRHGHCG